MLFLKRIALRFITYIGICTYCCFRLLLSGPAPCRFSPTCGPYTLTQLKEKPLFEALRAIAIRVWNCSPWGSPEIN